MQEVWFVWAPSLDSVLWRDEEWGITVKIPGHFCQHNNANKYVNVSTVYMWNNCLLKELVRMYVFAKDHSALPPLALMGHTILWWRAGGVAQWWSVCLDTGVSGIKPLPCRESPWRMTSIVRRALGKGRFSCTQKWLLLAADPLSHSLLCQEPSPQPPQATEPLPLPHLTKERNYHCGAHTKSSAQGTDCLPESSQWAVVTCGLMAKVCWGNTLVEILSLCQLYKPIQPTAAAL